MILLRFLGLSRLPSFEGCHVAESVSNNAVIGSPHATLGAGAATWQSLPKNALIITDCHVAALLAMTVKGSDCPLFGRGSTSFALSKQAMPAFIFLFTCSFIFNFQFSIVEVIYY
jgi:hypothetical protein